MVLGRSRTLPAKAELDSTQGGFFDFESSFPVRLAGNALIRTLTICLKPLIIIGLLRVLSEKYPIDLNALNLRESTGSDGSHHPVLLGTNIVPLAIATIHSRKIN